jgi:protein O-GlcNAc transferase
MTVLSITEMYSIASRYLLAGDADKARAIYRKLVAYDATEPHALYLLGRSEHACGRNDEAIAVLRRSVAACPPDNPHLLTVVWNQIGECYRAQGFHVQAVNAYRCALDVEPGSIDALCNMGISLRRLGRLEDACCRLREAIKLRPGKAAAHNNLGNVLRKMGKHEAAEMSYREAIAHNSGLLEAHNNLANTLRDRGDLDGAIDGYERALALGPGAIEVLSNLWHAAARRLEFDRAARAARRLTRMTGQQLERGIATSEDVFACSLRGADGTAILQVAQARAAVFGKPTPLASPASAIAGRRLRIGYLIDGCGNRPAWRRLRYLAIHHDDARFDMQIYRTGATEAPDEVFKGLAPVVDLADLDDGAAACRIAEYRPDVLVDLVGQQPEGRLGILAHRPAARQIVWSDIDLTSGLSAIDFLVTDAVATPEQLATNFSEKLLYLPSSHRMMGAFAPDQSGTRCGQAESLPEGSEPIVFAVLGRPLRFGPEIVGAWMHILSGAPDSVLKVNRINPRSFETLQDLADRHGIDRSRIRMSARQSTRTRQLQMLAQAHIALDTAPNNSAASVCDALVQGLPVVSLCGAEPPARSGSSLLDGFGIPECSTHTIDDYIACAVSLARDGDKRAALRSRLLALHENCLDEAIRCIEEAYIAMASEPQPNNQ